MWNEKRCGETKTGRMLGTVLGALKKMGAVNPTQTDDLLFRIFVAAYSLNMILHMKTMYSLFGYTIKIL